MRKQIPDDCEMCSTEAPNLTTIKVEGALLRVCPRCTQFGNIVVEKKPVTRGSPSAIRSSPNRSSRPLRRPPIRRRSTSGLERELIDDYDRVIRNARQAKKLPHERLASLTGISVATLRSIESGKMRPTDRDAKTIERELSLNLFTESEIELEFSEKKKKRATTFGDIAVIKRYDLDKD